MRSIPPLLHQISMEKTMKIFYVVGIVLMVLKLCSVITPGWGWIALIGLAPLWVLPVVSIVLVFVGMCLAAAAR